MAEIPEIGFGALGVVETPSKVNASLGFNWQHISAAVTSRIHIKLTGNFCSLPAKIVGSFAQLFH